MPTSHQIICTKRSTTIFPTFDRPKFVVRSEPVVSAWFLEVPRKGLRLRDAK